MIKGTTYHPNWQLNRIRFMISHYPKEFFKGKRILELGPFNGYIGAFFADLGAEVHCIEGRKDNVKTIKRDYPQLNVTWGNLDTDKWGQGRWDIIINFGLYYHLQHFHTEHLTNCINNCDLMFFESVIYNSMDSEIWFRQENGNDIDSADQSVSLLGGSPSTSFVEDIFKINMTEFTKYTNPMLNGNGHHYDWKDTKEPHQKSYNSHSRRMWIVKK